MKQKLISHIVSHYNLPALKVEEKITRGVLSNNYSLSDNSKRYFLKQWRFDKEDRIKEILLVEEFFESQNIPVISALANASGKKFFAYNDSFYSLYPFVDGAHIEKDDLSGVAIDSMAIMLANIHLKSREATVPNIKQFKNRNLEKALIKIEELHKLVENISDKSLFDLTALEQLSRKLSLITTPIISKQLNLPSDTLIHGDYHESNIFFDGTEVSHVFDFEKAEIAPRALELIRCVKVTFINGNYTQKNLERAAHFIGIYSKECPISKQEVKQGLYQWFNWGISKTWIEEEHYQKNNKRPDVFLESELKSLRYETDHLEELASYLTHELHS